jgi:hypothetical protein
VVPAYQGPVLLRGSHLDGPGPVGFGEQPLVSALIIPPDPTLNEADGYRMSPGGIYVTRPGCYGVQVDGTRFSYLIVLETPAPTDTRGGSSRGGRRRRYGWAGPNETDHWFGFAWLGLGLGFSRARALKPSHGGNDSSPQANQSDGCGGVSLKASHGPGARLAATSADR